MFKSGCIPTRAEFKTLIETQASKYLQGNETHHPVDTDWIPPGCTEKDVCIGFSKEKSTRFPGNRRLNNLLFSLKGQRRGKLIIEQQEESKEEVVARMPEAVRKHHERLQILSKQRNQGQKHDQDQSQQMDVSFTMQDQIIVDVAIQALQADGARFLYSRDYSASEEDIEFEEATDRQASMLTGFLFFDIIQDWSGVEPSESGSRRETANRSAEMFFKALKNYEKFHNLKTGSSNLEVLEATSAGIKGWANSDITSNDFDKTVSNDTAQDRQQQPIECKGQRGDDVEAGELQFALLESMGARPTRPENSRHFDEEDSEEHESFQSSYSYDEDP